MRELAAPSVPPAKGNSKVSDWSETALAAAGRKSEKSMRTRTSFQKRQKEIARAEKQRDKAAKRMQKKLLGKQPLPTDEMLTGQLRELQDDESEVADDESETADSAGHQE